MPAKFIQVITAIDDRATAARIAGVLLESRLAACVQISSPVQSIYWWKGKIENAAEVRLLIKTRESLYPLVEKAIRELHPYEVPEIIALPVTKGFAPYLRWITDELVNARTNDSRKKQ